MERNHIAVTHCQKVFPQNKPNEEFLYNLYTGFSLSQYENMESYMSTIN